MASTAKFAEIAALAGDPARAVMLHALMDGRALTAGELARHAAVAPQTASGHLGRLSESGLVSADKQGRHRYYRLASPAVAQMMESIMQAASVLEPPRGRPTTGPRDEALRRARTCYDHIAGRLGVALADALVVAGHVELEQDAGAMTPRGMALFAELGIDIDPSAKGKRTKRVLCRPCLDWSERRPHLSGIVGAALCAHSFDKGWIRRIEGTRALSVSPEGARAFQATFGVEMR